MFAASVILLHTCVGSLLLWFFFLMSWPTIWFIYQHYWQPPNASYMELSHSICPGFESQHLTWFWVRTSYLVLSHSIWPCLESQHLTWHWVTASDLALGHNVIHNIWPKCLMQLGLIINDVIHSSLMEYVSFNTGWTEHQNSRYVQHEHWIGSYWTLDWQSIYTRCLYNMNTRVVHIEHCMGRSITTGGMYLNTQGTEHEHRRFVQHEHWTCLHWTLEG